MRFIDNKRTNNKHLIKGDEMFKSLIVLTILCLISCEEYKGQLNLNDHLDLAKDSSISAGNYKAELKIKSERKIKVTLKNEKEKKSFTLKLSERAKLPRDGYFHIHPEDNNQNLELSGKSFSNVLNTRTYAQTLSCEILIPRRFCERRCRRVNRRTVCRRVCQVRYISRPGIQDFEYEEVTTKHNLDLQIYNSSNKVIGTLLSSRLSRDTQEIYRSRCYR